MTDRNPVAEFYSYVYEDERGNVLKIDRTTGGAAAVSVNADMFALVLAEHAVKVARELCDRAGVHVIILEAPMADTCAPPERGQRFGGAGAQVKGGSVSVSVIPVAGSTASIPLDPRAARDFAAYIATCARAAESRDAEVDELTKVILASRAADSTEGPTARAAAQAVIAAGWKRETPA